MIKQLSPSIQQALREIDAIFTKNSYRMWLVGGACRDLLLGETPNDIDLATDALPEVTMQLFRNAGYTVVPSGLSHGTVLVKIAGEPFEITTLRYDRECDGRHAVVEFTTDIVADCARRDLTINAMALSLDGTLTDPFGGQDDLRNGIVSFVGDAYARMSEDYLRICRYFRFRARFADTSVLPDTETLKALERASQGFKGIARERIWVETQKTIQVDASQFALMLSIQGIRAAIDFPEFDIDVFLAANNLNLTGKTTPSLVIGAALYSQNDVDKLARDWKVSLFERKQMKFARSVYDTPVRDRTAFLEREVSLGGISLDWVFEVLYLKAGENRDIITQMRQFKIREFPVRGQDIISELGVAPGPEVSRLMKDATDIWIASRYRFRRSKLLLKVAEKNGLSFTRTSRY